MHTSTFRRSIQLAAKTVPENVAAANSELVWTKRRREIRIVSAGIAICFDGVFMGVMDVNILRYCQACQVIGLCDYILPFVWLGF